MSTQTLDWSNLFQAVAWPTPSFNMELRDLSAVDELVVHHSAGPQDQDPLAIDQAHRARGFAMVGYHYLVLPTGKVVPGRALNAVPAAAQGQNYRSVDVCVLGNFQPADAGYNGPPTPAAVGALERLSVYVHSRVPSIARTIGHRDVGAEQGYVDDCPGDDLEGLLPALRDYTRKALSI